MPIIAMAVVKNMETTYRHEASLVSVDWFMVTFCRCFLKRQKWNHQANKCTLEKFLLFDKRNVQRNYQNNVRDIHPSCNE